jgi:hypothetical protein
MPVVCAGHEFAVNAYCPGAEAKILNECAIGCAAPTSSQIVAYCLAPGHKMNSLVLRMSRNGGSQSERTWAIEGALNGFLSVARRAASFLRSSLSQLLRGQDPAAGETCREYS